MSLYRKYRPSNFSNLVGQDHVRITLMNALKTGNIHHAYLFTGPRGTGKTSTARLLAKAINCENPQDTEPCGKCEICRDISEGRLIDLIEIDAASNRGIDEIRDLREKIQFAPTRAKSKVYIIDEVHMLTKEAFNALLKTLEEPPAHVYFILATTEVHKIPETILSRCQRFDFKRIDEETLKKRLAFIAQQENIEVNENALLAIVHYCQGGLRDAIGLLEQLTFEGKLDLTKVEEVLGLSTQMALQKIYQLLGQKQAQEALQEIDALYTAGADLHQFTKDFLEFLRRKLLTSVEQQATAEIKLNLKFIALFQEAYENLKFAAIPQLPLEIAMIEACYAQKNTDVSTDLEIERKQQNINDSNKKKTLILDSKKDKPLSDSTPDTTNQDTGHEQMSKPSTNVDSDESHSREQQLEGGLRSREPAVPLTDVSPQTITLETLQARWHEVSEKMKIVPARRLLSMARLLSIRGSEITLGFRTNFDLNKLMENVNRLDIESALSEVFGMHLTIIGEVEKIHIASENVNQSPEGEDEAESKLMEVFGGEMM